MPIGSEARFLCRIRHRTRLVKEVILFVNEVILLGEIPLKTSTIESSH